MSGFEHSGICEDSQFVEAELEGVWDVVLTFRPWKPWKDTIQTWSRNEFCRIEGPNQFRTLNPNPKSETLLIEAALSLFLRLLSSHNAVQALGSSYLLRPGPISSSQVLEPSIRIEGFRVQEFRV